MKAILALVAAFLLFSPAARAQSYPQYYGISNRAKAQAEAQARHLPLAWMGAYHADIMETSPDHDSEAELTQMAMADLQGQAVVILFEASNMGPVPGVVHAQDHIQDDGPLPGGASWSAPKIVFTNPQVTRALGRVSRTQMASDREMAINVVLQQIAQDSTALQPSPTPAPATQPLQTGAPNAPALTEHSASADGSDKPEEANVAEMDNEDLDISPEERAFWAWMHRDGIYAGFGVIIFLTCSMMLSKKKS